MPEPLDPISPELERALTRCGETVRRVGRQHGLPPSDVDEVFQEVRIRLWKALASGEKIGAAPASYVYRTAQSAAVDLIRRRRAKREETVDMTRPSGEAMLGTNPGPDVAAERAEVLQALERAVEELTESRRPVVRMYLAGYRVDEIAEVLAWTEAKTRNLVYRGLADLRARLTELGFGPEATA